MMDDKIYSFVQLWGTLATHWGINRTMAQVHALLLVKDEALSTEQIMEALSISRGNANTNLRELVQWQLIYKEIVPGDRKEYFRAEKDIWLIAKRIIVERKKREIDPAKHALQNLVVDKKMLSSKEDIFFNKKVIEIIDLMDTLDKMSNVVMKADNTGFVGSLVKMFK